MFGQQPPSLIMDEMRLRIAGLIFYRPQAPRLGRIARKRQPVAGKLRQITRLFC